MTFVLSTLPGQTQWSSGSSNRDTIGWSLGREHRLPQGTAEHFHLETKVSKLIFGAGAICNPTSHQFLFHDEIVTFPPIHPVSYFGEILTKPFLFSPSPVHHPLIKWGPVPSR